MTEGSPRRSGAVVAGANSAGDARELIEGVTNETFQWRPRVAATPISSAAGGRGEA